MYAKHKEFIPLKMQRGYQPDGWLGALLGTKLYTEFSHHYPFEAQIGKLIDQIQKTLKVSLQ